MPLNEHQYELLKSTEIATAAGDPAEGARIMRELLASVELNDHETRGRLSITLAHFLKESGQLEPAIEAYLEAASLLEPLRGEAALEAAHACFGAGLLLVDSDHPDASKTTGRALELYQRYPFTRPADIADAAVLHLAAQTFTEHKLTESNFHETWELVRDSSPEEMTLLEQWLYLTRSLVPLLAEEKGTKLAAELSEWQGEDEDAAEATPPGTEPSRPGPPDTIPSAKLMSEIRAGYDELKRAQERGVELAEVELQVIEMLLSLRDVGEHPRILLAGAFFSVGRCFTELDDDQQAERYYRQAIACDATHASARYNLGNVLMRRGENQEPAELFKSVVDEDPDNNFALRNLTYVLARAGDVTAAIEAAAANALVATEPDVSAARLLELCALNDAWSTGRPIVEQKLQGAAASAERMQRLRILLAPLLEDR